MGEKGSAVICRPFFYAIFMSVVACDQDEVKPDPTTGNGDVNDVTRLSLYELEIQVQTPEAMENVEDAHAAMAVGYVESINSFSAFSTFFLPPEGATKRNTPINASNARVTTSKICLFSIPYCFWWGMKFEGVVWRAFSTPDPTMQQGD